MEHDRRVQLHLSQLYPWPSPRNTSQVSLSAFSILRGLLFPLNERLPFPESFPIFQFLSFFFPKCFFNQSSLEITFFLIVIELNLNARLRCRMNIIVNEKAAISSLFPSNPYMLSP